MAQNIIVVGAGIVGACAAYNLQKSGAQVTVVDARQPSATEASFGWINASFFANPDHFHLRADSIAAYRELAKDVPLSINWCGALCWETTGAAFDAQRDELLELGYRVDEIDARAFAELEPHVGTPPERCLVFPNEAAADSGAMAAQLLDAAITLGARVITGVTVDGFECESGRVTGIRSAEGTLRADQVLVATGTATQALMARVDVNVPMLTRPALMLKTRPVAPILRHVLVSEIGEVRQLPCGSILMPAAIDHQRDTAEVLHGAPHQVADEALARLQAMIPNTELHWSCATLVQRPVPKDGLPIVGRTMDGLYVATMHSGITLGALMGQLIASEMLGGPAKATSGRLAPYRPARFAE